MNSPKEMHDNAPEIIEAVHLMKNPNAAGKLKVKGDLSLAMKLQALVGLNRLSWVLSCRSRDIKNIRL